MRTELAFKAEVDRILDALVAHLEGTRMWMGCRGRQGGGALDRFVQGPACPCAGLSRPPGTLALPVETVGGRQARKVGMKMSYPMHKSGFQGRPMSATEKRTVSLSAEQAAYIDSLVASGAYATASEVVRAGVRALQDRDTAVDRWLREAVVPGFAARPTGSQYLGNIILLVGLAPTIPPGPTWGPQGIRRRPGSSAGDALAVEATGGGGGRWPRQRPAVSAWEAALEAGRCLMPSSRPGREGCRGRGPCPSRSGCAWPRICGGQRPRHGRVPAAARWRPDAKADALMATGTPPAATRKNGPCRVSGTSKKLRTSATVRPITSRVPLAREGPVGSPPQAACHPREDAGQE